MKGNEKMNEQQWEKRLGPLQKWYGHSFINRTVLVGTISAILLAIFLFSSWNTIVSVIHSASLSKHAESAQVHIRSSFVRLNIDLIIRAIHDEQVAARVDHMLIRKMKQEGFSGSVLIAHNGHIILSK